MLVIFNGMSCFMMWDIRTEKYVYIPEQKWYDMPYEQREFYREER